MTPRIERLKKDFMDNYNHMPISAEKVRLVVEAWKKHIGHSEMMKNAWAFENFLDHRTIFIEDDQLLVGNLAQYPHGIDYQPFGPLWPDDDLDKILAGEGFSMTDEDRAFLRSCDEILDGTGISFSEMETFYYDEETDRLWNFRKRGMHMPAFTDRKVGFSSYTAGWGWSMEPPCGLNAPAHELHLYTGLQKFIDECQARRTSMHFHKLEDLKRYEGYLAMEIALSAVIRIYERYAALCDQKAAECQDEKRAAELREMARVCRKVPKYGAETFWEAMQYWTVYWMIFAQGATPMGRMDYLLWPFLEKDLAEGRITEERAIELLQCFMVKVCDYTFITGMPTQREKYAGRARWNIIILGGVDPDGNDVTNPLTYMILKASRDLHLPSPSIHIRVNENTPKELMMEGLQAVKEGMGFPSFISEKAYIDYLIEHSHGEIDEREAREFIVNGCVDTALPGRSRQTGVPMMPMPVVLELAMDGGKDTMMGTDIGFACKGLVNCGSYEEFYNDCLLPNLRKMIETGVEITVIRYGANCTHCDDPARAAFFYGALDEPFDPYRRKMKYEPACGVNMVGMSTCIDSLAAIKYVCFDKKLATPAELLQALHDNWEGHEELRQLCLKAPKYGNADDYVDDIGEKLWKDIHDIARDYKGPWGNELCLSAVSITTHGPAGKVTGASANGRHSGEILSDASISPSQGCDTCGPTAMIKSAMRMGHGYSSTLHNAKFSKSVMSTEQDLSKLADLIRVYLTQGGHQIQINVVDQETLLDAQAHPENHRDLLVRVAGYSTYFTLLNKAMQSDVINRTSLGEI